MATAATENASTSDPKDQNDQKGQTLQKDQTPPKDANPGKRKFWLLLVLVLVVVGALGIWFWYEKYGRWNQSTDDAYVNGNVVVITPLVTGTVVSIGADDGDLVREGQVLMQFDPSDAEVGLQSAEANLGKTVRQVRGLYSNVDGMKAQLAAQR
ncbi:biotin/lipoyl-binding protein, partial [Pseudomonas sp. CCC3.2]